MPDPSHTFRKPGFWRSLKDAWNEPSGLPASPASREAGREARSSGREMERNPHQDPSERAGWSHGWASEDGRAARARDHSSRQLNHHPDGPWREAWDRGWVEQDGWIAAGEGRPRAGNPHDARSDAGSFTSWDRGWVRCEQDMAECRREGAKARAREQSREGAGHRFEHLSSSWRRGWDEEDARLAQQEGERLRRAEERRRAERERIGRVQQLEQERARLAEHLCRRVAELSTPGNDIAVDVERTREGMRHAIEHGEVTRAAVEESERVYRLDRRGFAEFNRLNGLSRGDGTNTPEEAELIDCYLGPSPEHFNAQEHAVRSSLCRIFARMRDHYGG